MLSILLNILRLVLWCILENVPFALKMYSAVVDRRFTSLLGIFGLWDCSYPQFPYFVLPCGSVLESGLLKSPLF